MEVAEKDVEMVIAIKRPTHRGRLNDRPRPTPKRCLIGQLPDAATSICGEKEAPLTSLKCRAQLPATRREYQGTYIRSVLLPAVPDTLSLVFHPLRTTMDDSGDFGLHSVSKQTQRRQRARDSR